MTLALERRRSHVTAASHIKTIYEDNKNLLESTTR